MIEFRGSYFDGTSSRAHAVVVHYSGEVLSVRGDEVNVNDVPLNECTIPPVLGTTTRSLLLPGGGRCDTDDLEAIAALERSLGTNSGMRVVHFFESKWLLVALCFAGLIVCTWLFISHGIPFIANKAAAAVPLNVTERLSMQTLDVLDEHYLAPTGLSKERVKELETVFHSLVADKEHDFNYRIELRLGGGIVGANAFALPSGLILMTDELVALSESDEELIGILFHEIVHVEERHGMRMVLQNAGVALLVSALAGDVASITSVASTLPTVLAQTGYSRNFEREADRGAGRYMIEQGWGTKPLEAILGRLSKRAPDMAGMSILSTHPGTEERLKNLRAMEQ